AEGLLRAQRTVEQVEVEDTVAAYCVDLAAATRTRPQVLVGASPRGALAVLRRRDYVTPEDVKAVALAVLTHRITLKPEMWLRRVSPQDVVKDVLGEVPAPPTAVRSAVPAG